MEIVKKSANQLEFKDQDASVSMSADSNGSISLIVAKGDQSIVLEKPGEYEYWGLHILALEIPAEGGYKGKIDILSIGLEGNIDFLFVFKKCEFSDELKERFNPNVLTTNIADSAMIKAGIKAFQVEKIVLLSGPENKSEIDKIKGEFGKVEEGNKKIKFRDTDFNTEEDTIQEVIIL